MQQTLMKRPGDRPRMQPWAGIGWRQPHYRELIERRPALGFIEVHSENFFGDGGAALAVLEQGRAHYPVSLHGVGLALGSAAGLDEAHLAQLARLVERIEPVRVSDHASFARVASPQGVLHASDLLPVAFDRASLDLMATHVQQVQDRLRRPLLVENLSAYVQPLPLAEALSEPAFFNALTRRTGCGLLLDVNNLVVNALNAHGFNDDMAVAAACAWIDAIDPASVGEIHLAGYCDTGDLVIDDHGSRVHAPVWAVYRHALQRLGPRPTLIEWDTDVPALDVLLDEARLAERCVAEAHGRPTLGAARVGQPVGAVRHAAAPVAEAQLALVAAIRGLPVAPPLAGASEQVARGLAAYRGNASALAERALAAAYPTVHQLMGDDAFSALARALWQAHPATVGDMACWGGALADFFADTQGVPDAPYLADVARLDWAVHRAGFAADGTGAVSGLALLGSGEPDQLWLQWAPGAGGLASDWPVVTIWQAHRSEATDRFAAVQSAFDRGQAEHAWWWRQGWRVAVTTLDAATACFHAAINLGLSLAQALSQVLALHPHFDFTRWLHTALQAGWLAAVQAHPIGAVQRELRLHEECSS